MATSKKVDLRVVERVIDLSRIALTPETRDRLGREMAEILEIMDRVRDSDPVEAAVFATPQDLRRGTREDRVVPGLAAEAALDAAPERTEDGSYRVPPLLGEG